MCWVKRFLQYSSSVFIKLIWFDRKENDNGSIRSGNIHQAFGRIISNPGPMVCKRTSILHQISWESRLHIRREKMTSFGIPQPLGPTFQVAQVHVFCDQLCRLTNKDSLAYLLVYILIFILYVHVNFACTASLNAIPTSPKRVAS